VPHGIDGDLQHSVRRGPGLFQHPNGGIPPPLHGEIAFGAIQATLDLSYSPSMVLFSWAGFDEMDEVIGDGSAELFDDGSIEITFAYHDGDEAILKAKRITSSTAC
jgi:hypothetical protein